MATESQKANGEIISNTEEKKAKSKKKTVSINDEEIAEVEATVKITKPKKTISTSVDIDRQFLSDGRIEETKTTTTNTIINGKVEDTKVNKETRILSDEEAKAVIQEGSEEEEEEEEIEDGKQKSVTENSKKVVQQNGYQEITTTETLTEIKKVTENGEAKISVTKEESEEEEEEVEQEEEEYEEAVVADKQKVIEVQPEAKAPETPESEKEEEEEEQKEPLSGLEKEEEEEEDEAEEIELVVAEKQDENCSVSKNIPEMKKANEDAEESEEDEEQAQEEEEEEEEEVVMEAETKKTEVSIEKNSVEATSSEKLESTPSVERGPKDKQEDIEIHIQRSTTDKENVHIKTETSETKADTNISTPIPEVHSSAKKETTEISSTLSDTPFASTRTELHRVENVITTNKTTKILDNEYNQITNQGVPTVKTYFAPNRERVSISPSKPYTPAYSAPPKAPTTERRHSLLLDRLSTERQFAPPESYQNTYNQSYETVSNTWAQQPQSEVVIASNVKPSSINNSQWYQQPHQEPQQTCQASTNVIYNNVKPTTPAPQPAYQQSSYDNSYSAPAYTPEQQSYAPKPSSWGSNNLGNLDRLPSINSQSNQYSFMSNKTSNECYTQKTNGTQRYSGYVPPPWEVENVSSYQPSPYYDPPNSAPILTQNSTPAWTPATQCNYKKPRHSYQPPAPNASFVKQASPAATPGRKTYYSEYERRYISVPESTYVPTETKVQPQWNASPQYYYDNAEPVEQVEPTWRKELREFTEKSTIQETTTVQPPWMGETEASAYSSQPAWSQTMRPQSYREKIHEPEYVQQSQEWPRSQSRRPISAFINKSYLDTKTTERTRGVSVDRYNANTYQPPSSYTPSASNEYAFSWENQDQSVSQQTRIKSTDQQKVPSASSYHNPNVPAYHVRPTESRDIQVSYAPRWSGQGREIPVQSRSFRYLQMLTGTEDGVEQPEPFREVQPHHAVPKPRRA